MSAPDAARRMGVIGTGGIAPVHPTSAAGRGGALCNRPTGKTEAKAARLAPKARVTDGDQDSFSSHNPRIQRKNPAAAGSREHVREGKWRRGWV